MHFFSSQKYFFLDIASPWPLSKFFFNKPILDFPEKHFEYWSIKIGLGRLTVHLLDLNAGVTDLHVAGGQ